MSNFPPGGEFDRRAPYNQPVDRIVKVDVIVYKDAVQVSNSMNNFTVQQPSYDLGVCVGYGATEEDAIESFEESYCMKYDELCEAVIINTVIE